jgi:putative phage-type endonuclease
MERARLLEERATILGGSDMEHLLGLEPFGCQRRLAYDKTGIPADFPFQGNADTERGARLEEIAVEEFEKQTGESCRKRGLIHGQEPWEACHIDREITLDGRIGHGVLEVKIPSSWNFQILSRQPELPEAYQVQLQWGLAVTGWNWGAVWIWSPDKWKGRCQPYNRDEQKIAFLRRAAGFFWTDRQVWIDRKEFRADPFEHIERLDPFDRRCVNCPWRRKCQNLGDFPQEVLDDATVMPGAPRETDESIRPLAELYVELRMRAKEVEEEKAEIAEALKLALGERRHVECSAAKVSYSDVAACEYTVKRQAERRLTVRAKHG